MIYERHGLRLTVYAPNEKAADNLENYFRFWPEKEPAPRSTELTPPPQERAHDSKTDD